MTLRTLWLTTGLCLGLYSLPSSAAEMAPAAIVQGFLDSWKSNDIDKIMAFVSDDCHYANVPTLSGGDGVITGRAKMREFLAPFFTKEPLTVPLKFRTEIKHVIAGGDGVALERVDYFDVGSAHYAVPVAAMFKVKNGKINYWVDYFDGSTFGPVGTIMATFPKK